MTIENGKYGRKEKLDAFLSFLNKAGFETKVLASESYPNFVDIETKLDGNPLLIHANIRNIGSAYLPNEPTTRRRQVEGLDVFKLPKNTSCSITILVGLSGFSDSVIVTIWNAFNFCMHKTVRSCYVTEESLLEAAEYGISFEKYGMIPSYSCQAARLEEALKSFIQRSRTE